MSVSLSELLLLSMRAKKLPLSPFKVRNVQSGQQFSRLFGRGMEFAECRRYQEGDDIRSIDWRVTARTGKVHTKLFSAEKERNVLICTDMRSPMFFATQGVFKSVQASLITGYLAWSAVQTGNRLGGMIFDNEKQEEFRPAAGKRGVLPILQRLADHASLKTDRGKHTSPLSMDDAINSIKRVALPGSLVFVISDFRNLSITGRDMLAQLSTHCDLCLCFLYDALEMALPMNGYYPVSDGVHERRLNTFDKKVLTHYQEQFIQRRDRVSSLGLQKHIQYIKCSTEDDCIKVLHEHFR